MLSRNSYDDRRADAVMEALDLAWREVSPLVAAQELSDDMRRVLHGLVLELASQGEADPQRLRDYALRRFYPLLAYCDPRWSAATSQRDACISSSMNPRPTALQ